MVVGSRTLGGTGSYSILGLSMLHIHPQPLRYFCFKDKVLLVAQVGLKLRTILLNNGFFLIGWLMMLGMALCMPEKHRTKMHLHFIR